MNTARHHSTSSNASAVDSRPSCSTPSTCSCCAARDVRLCTLDERREELRQAIKHLPDTIRYSETFSVPLSALMPCGERASARRHRRQARRQPIPLGAMLMRKNPTQDRNLASEEHDRHNNQAQECLTHLKGNRRLKVNRRTRQTHLVRFGQRPYQIHAA